MKKMLTLVLVLVMAAMTNALTLSQTSKTDIFSLSFNSANNTLSIVSDADIAAGGGKEMYWGMAVTTGAGTLSNTGSSSVTGTGFDVKVENSATLADLGLGTGILGTIFTTGGAIPAGSLIWDIPVAGPAAGSVVSFYKLSNDMDAIAGTLYTGTFVPEPITMTLLGLGGLFLRRRK